MQARLSSWLDKGCKGSTATMPYSRDLRKGQAGNAQGTRATAHTDRKPHSTRIRRIGMVEMPNRQGRRQMVRDLVPSPQASHARREGRAKAGVFRCFFPRGRRPQCASPPPLVTACARNPSGARSSKRECQRPVSCRELRHELHRKNHAPRARGRYTCRFRI